MSADRVLDAKTSPVDSTPLRDRDAYGLVPSVVAVVVGLPVVGALLVVVPYVGALLAVASFVALVPLGSRLASTRLVVGGALGCGILALVLALGDQLAFRVLTPDRVRVAFLVPALVAAGVVLVCAARRRPLPVAVPDLGLATIAVVVVAGWAVTGSTALGVDVGHGIGGLMSRGWDHQSHFSIYSSLYEQGGVWRPGDPDDASRFWDYPPLAGALCVVVAILVSPGDTTPVAQFPLYIQSTALLFAVGAALLAWTAGSVARRMAASSLRARGSDVVGLAAGVVTGGYVLLGQASALFDFGFVNFFFGVALATTTTWVVVAVAPRWSTGAVAVPAALAVATATALAQLWTPLVVLAVPAGLLVAVRLVRARAWFLLGLTVVAAAIGAWTALWQTTRLAATGADATSLASTLAAVGGGQPPVPTSHLVALATIGLAGPLVLGARWRTAFWGLLVAPAAGLAIVLAFAVNTMRLDFPLADSYYVAKCVWIVYLTLIPVIGPAVASAAVRLQRVLAARKDDRWRHARVAGAAVVAASLVWASAPTSLGVGASIDYYSEPLGAQAVSDRHDAFRDITQGLVVVGAIDATRRWPNRLAIAWDSGDLLTNRWLASLRGDLNTTADEVYTAMSDAPYGESARDALQAALAAHPELKLAIVVVTPESQELLKPLKRAFPDRVVVVAG